MSIVAPIVAPTIFSETIRLCITLFTRLCLCAVVLWYSPHLRANDGAYFATGNLLIPMMETDIIVQKEILSIRCVNSNMVQITVYYEFFNPKAAKTLDVGFEAISPSGDTDGTPIKGQHPYIKDFTVNMNGQALPHAVAIVEEKNYYKNGKITGISLQKALKSIQNVNEVPFNYVYHFKANFKPGLNTITHTYSFQISGSVDMNYNIPYIFTAATRWGNRRIDDFTLNIDMGAFADFFIAQTFFTGFEGWQIQGTGKYEIIPQNTETFHPLASNTLHFWLRDGMVVFRKKNFAPQEEFNLFALQPPLEDSFHADSTKLSFGIGIVERSIQTARDEASLKILRNLPFARRGMVFKTPEIQRYYEKLVWYQPNPAYQADTQKLLPVEQEWLKRLKKVR